MKKLYFLSLLLTSMINLTAQNIKIGFETGIGTYQMTNLKAFMQTAIEGNELEPQVITNFPAYLYFQPSITFCRAKNNWGFNFTVESTGARASIRDYTGEYRYDNEVIGYATSIFRESALFQNNKFALYLGSDLGIIYSSVYFSEYLQLAGEELINESIKTMSINVFIKPYIKATYTVSDKINIVGDFGYHADMWRGGLSEPMDLITYLQDVGQKGHYLQWNGIRCAIGCTYTL